MFNYTTDYQYIYNKIMPYLRTFFITMYFINTKCIIFVPQFNYKMYDKFTLIHKTMKNVCHLLRTRLAGRSNRHPRAEQFCRRLNPTRRIHPSSDRNR